MVTGGLTSFHIFCNGRSITITNFFPAIPLLASLLDICGRSGTGFSSFIHFNDLTIGETILLFPKDTVDHQCQRILSEQPAAELPSGRN
jgi:hypothetical protein